MGMGNGPGANPLRTIERRGKNSFSLLVQCMDGMVLAGADHNNSHASSVQLHRRCITLALYLYITSLPRVKV
jgi:hypothetical protein